MEIQSLSIAVPLRGCVNTCPFCVSRMHGMDYKDNIGTYLPIHIRDYKNRMLFARKNGCNTAILTGTGEALQNLEFVRRFGQWNQELGDERFLWLELQSTGVLLEQNLDLLRDDVQVTTIALSVSDIFNSENNASVVKMPPKYKVDLDDLCAKILAKGFNLRISLNLYGLYDEIAPELVFDRMKQLGAHQVIVRKLYESGEDKGVDQWVRDHAAKYETILRYRDFILNEGSPLEKLPFGSVRYSVRGMSTVIDENCMPHELTNSFRYLILRPDTKLYSRWDDKGSIVF